MKKTKAFLSALTVLAALGGALAFKAKGLTVVAECDTVPAQKLCTLNPTFSIGRTTTGTHAEIIPYDEFGDPCVFTDNKWTCTTRLLDE